MGPSEMKRKNPSCKQTSDMESSPPNTAEEPTEEACAEKWEKFMTSDSWSLENRVCVKCLGSRYRGGQRGRAVPLPTGSGERRVRVCWHFARTWLRDTVLGTREDTGAKLFLDLVKEEPSPQETKAGYGGVLAKEDLDNFMHLRRAVRYFLNTGVFTTVSMEYGDGPQEDDLKGDEFSTRVRDVISVKDNKHSVIDNHIERNTIIERYTISRLKGDWEALTGVAWKYGKEESNTSLERPEEKERGAIANSCKMEWSSAQRRTVVAMLMYVVLTEGREPLPEAIRPAPIRGGVAAGVWTWTIVQDCQTRHDGEGLARTKLLIANLDKHKFLPKAVIGTELEMPETNLRASTKMLQEFQEEHRGDAYMAVDSIGELASYSGREVFLLLLGLVVACGGAWALNTGAGFFLLAVLCANRLEQEINFKLFMFVWDRWLRSRGREPVVARPSSDIRANYCMVAGFGVVEALFDDERISVVVGKVSAIVLTAVVFVVALPPALFVWTKRRESNYKGPYPLVSPERQDWIRNSVGVFYGSCSECFFGGAGRGYRGADAQGGRLLNWLAGCSVNNVMWTGTSAGGVHHSIDTKMEHGGWWAVVG